MSGCTSHPVGRHETMGSHLHHDWPCSSCDDHCTNDYVKNNFNQTMDLRTNEKLISTSIATWTSVWVLSVVSLLMLGCSRRAYSAGIVFYKLHFCVRFFVSISTVWPSCWISCLHFLQVGWQKNKNSKGDYPCQMSDMSLQWISGCADSTWFHGLLQREVSQ